MHNNYFKDNQKCHLMSQYQMDRFWIEKFGILGFGKLKRVFIAYGS